MAGFLAYFASFTGYFREFAGFCILYIRRAKAGYNQKQYLHQHNSCFYGLFFSFVIIGESITFDKLVGIACVIVGVMLSQIKKNFLAK